MSHKRLFMAWACALAVALCVAVPRMAYAATGDILLGMFYTNDNDYTNSIYLSTNGSTFTRVATAYDTKGRDAWGTSIYYDANGGTHYGHADPSIMYYKGYFWALSGWNRQDGKFWPMISYSKDLVNWTHPEGDGLITGTHGVSLNTYPAGYSSSKKDFDTVAPEWFISKNGSVYIVFSAGYYGAFHGQPTQDRMQAYIVKVTALSAADGYADGSIKYRWPNSLVFKAGTAKRLNIAGNSATNANFIDGAMYTEGTKDYLVIKKNGDTNQLFSTTNINKNKWKLVNPQVSVGYEGASIAKLGSTYYMVGDKLSGTTAVGVSMFKSSSITTKGKWKAAKVRFVTQSGTTCPARHGSIITLKKGSAAWKVASKLMTESISKGAKVSAIKTQVYTGKAIKPSVTVKRGGKTLKKGVHYKLSYKNNVKAGTASVVITGIGPYSGSITKKFTIAKASLSKATITLKKTSYTYTGGKIKAPVTSVKVGKRSYKSGTDYTVSYSNNVSTGTATVKVTGTGSCKGSATTTFALTRKSIAGATIVLSEEDYTYTGSAIAALQSVQIGTRTLSASTDYKVTYANNVNAGTATVTVSGKGNYKGSTKATFAIARQSLSNAAVAIEAANFEYSGNAYTPAVTSVTLDQKTLQEGVDYTVGYENNTNAGEAAVIVMGTGNYEGIAQTTFVIAPKEVTVTAKNSGKIVGYGDGPLKVYIDGLVVGESEDCIAYKIYRDPGEEVDTYTIYVEGEEYQGNYHVTFKNGTFLIYMDEVIVY